MQEPPPLGPDSYQDAPHHAPCGSRLRLPEASNEEAKEAKPHAVIPLPAVEQFSATAVS